MEDSLALVLVRDLAPSLLPPRRAHLLRLLLLPTAVVEHPRQDAEHCRRRLVERRRTVNA
jgi:hypothetical protein